ncbi:Hypothetical predicted protein [Paramuricea clavata]|uniref:Uncharacterized protein n=1 Tax=Paramuricea clavata TaxID=317549 RepID=A0A7D9L870_PARCT|nr:Hypothetical predicted protein [Paramuricea clavata]
MKRQKLPEHDSKYEALRVTEWWQIEQAFKSCCTFDPTSRPSASHLLGLFNCTQPEQLFQLYPLSVSQATALEQHDHEVAMAVNSANSFDQGASIDGSETNPGFDDMVMDVDPPLSNGVNCCAFLALGVCDRFVQKTDSAKYSDTTCSWDVLKEAAENVINDLPRQISQLRDTDRYYDVSEANVILAHSDHLASEYDLFEECISGNYVFSHGSRAELVEALTRKIASSNDDISLRIGVYTCSPYIFTIGTYNGALFLVDTHPISEELGGNHNGLMMVTPDCSVHSCEMLVQWILKRLKLSGVKEDQYQSFSWVTKCQQREQFQHVSEINEEIPPNGIQDINDEIVQTYTDCNHETTTTNVRRSNETSTTQELKEREVHTVDIRDSDSSRSNDSIGIVKIVQKKPSDIESRGMPPTDNCNLSSNIENSSHEEQSSDEDQSSDEEHSDLETTLYNGDALTPFSRGRKKHSVTMI